MGFYGTVNAVFPFGIQIGVPTEILNKSYSFYMSKVSTVKERMIKPVKRTKECTNDRMNDHE